MSSSVEIRLLKVTMGSFDGAGVEHGYFNATDKEIKYLTFVYVPYNKVGDQVQCTMSEKSEVSCELTGPIKPYCQSRVKWEALWYNPTVTKVELVRIYIKYMDGTEETIDGADVVNMDDKQSVYYEKIGKAKEEEYKINTEKRKLKEAESKRKREEAQRRIELEKAYGCFNVLSCLDKAKNDEELKSHVNQGLWLLILEILAVIIIFIAVPIVGFVGFIIGLALIIVSIVFSRKGIKAIGKNERFELPILGKIKLLK